MENGGGGLEGRAEGEVDNGLMASSWVKGIWSLRGGIVEGGQGFSDTDEPSLESRVTVNVIDYGMDRRDDLRLKQILDSVGGESVQIPIRSLAFQLFRRQGGESRLTSQTQCELCYAHEYRVGQMKSVLIFDLRSSIESLAVVEPYRTVPYRTTYVNLGGANGVDTYR